MSFTLIMFEWWSLQKIQSWMKTSLICSHTWPRRATRVSVMTMKVFTQFTGSFSLENCHESNIWQTEDVQAKHKFCRKVFESITALEMEAGAEDSDDEIPSFGDSLSDFDDVCFTNSETSTKLHLRLRQHWRSDFQFVLLFPGCWTFLRILGILLHTANFWLDGWIWHTSRWTP